MKYIPLLFVLVTIGGCAISIEELMIEAKECVDHSTNELGVIGATPEQRTTCWVPVNEKLELIAKREAELEAAEASKCPRGTTKWCKTRGRIGPQSCTCMRNENSRRKLERLLGL